MLSDATLQKVHAYTSLSQIGYIAGVSYAGHWLQSPDVMTLAVADAMAVATA